MLYIYIYFFFCVGKPPLLSADAKPLLTGMSNTISDIVSLLDIMYSIVMS